MNNAPDSMEVLSVNIGKPRTVEWLGQQYTSSLMKYPTYGPTQIEQNGIPGDSTRERVAVRGPERAIYVYPSEHYGFWKRELALPGMDYGTLGENLTTAGLDAESLTVGTDIALGEAVVQVTEPRLPCKKFMAAYQTSAVAKLMLGSRRTGCFCRVVQPGLVQEGDIVRIISEPVGGPTIRHLVDIVVGVAEQDLMTNALSSEHLVESWRRRIESRLTKTQTDSLNREVM